MAGGVAIVHDHSERLHAIERLLKGILANAVEYRRDSARKQPANFSNEVGFAVKNRIIASMSACDRRLVLRAHRSEHGRSQILAPLAEQQPDTAGRAVNQYGVASFRTKYPIHDHRCGQSF